MTFEIIDKNLFIIYLYVISFIYTLLINNHAVGFVQCSLFCFFFLTRTLLWGVFVMDCDRELWADNEMQGQAAELDTTFITKL